MNRVLLMASGLMLGVALASPAFAEITPTVTAMKPIMNNVPQAPATGVVPAELLAVLPSGNYQYVLSYNHFGPLTPPPSGAGYPIGACISRSTVVVLTHNGDDVSLGHSFHGTLDGQGNISFSDGNPKVSMSGHLVGKDEILGSGMYPCTGGGNPQNMEFDLKWVP